MIFQSVKLCCLSDTLDASSVTSSGAGFELLLMTPWFAVRGPCLAVWLAAARSEWYLICFTALALRPGLLELDLELTQLYDRELHGELYLSVRLSTDSDQGLINCNAAVHTGLVIAARCVDLKNGRGTNAIPYRLTVNSGSYDR
jgi:hypothetical protein